ncbi:MAG: response regulator [Verrucomicrobia bacterium]|nr:response regulator [Verrucomicrobiota bacterium]
MATPIRVLIVEDRSADAELVVREMRRAGYAADWKRVETEADFLIALEESWDLLLADFSLPDFSGFSALKLMKEKGLNIPFLIVSGTIGEENAIAALKAGAGDCVMKDRLSLLGPTIERVLREADEKRECQEMQRALVESQKLYYSLVESMPQSVFRKDASGRYVFANQRFCEAIDRTLKDILGRTDADLFPPETAAALQKDDQRVMDSGQSLEKIQEWERLDGQKTTVRILRFPVATPSGANAGIQGIFWDVTDKIRDDARLKLQSVALEAAANAIAITNQDGIIEWVNESFSRVTGYPISDVLGQHTRILKSDKHDAAFYQNLWQTIHAGNTWHGELWNQRKNGSQYQEEMTIAPVKDERGNISHYIAIKQDISEKKELERRMLRAQRLESIGQLAGGIAHDLNNVLAPILMSVEFLKREITSEQSLKILDIVKASAQRGAGVVRQVLTFARGAEGARIVLQPKHLCKEIVKLAKETFPKPITVEADLAADLWVVTGDASQIDQVLMNLSVNARDAMPKGGVLRLTAENQTVNEDYASRFPDAKPGKYVCLTVEDTGTGMPPEVLDKVFEPFFTTKGQDRGTGLGLATTLGIVRSHGGFMHVQSRIGKGSSFRVFLPACETEELAQQSLDDVTEPKAEGECILIVDDEEGIRHLLMDILKDAGYQVLIASSGTEAAIIFAQKRSTIRAVVTDVQMPGLNGIELIRIVRGIEPSIKILLITGGAAEGDTEQKLAEAKNLNVHDSLMKPFTSTDFLNRLRKILKRETAAAVAKP